MEDANNTKLVTKNAMDRWIVEVRNGHLRMIFKIFEHTFNIQNAGHIGDYCRIAGAIINKYHPLIHMQGKTVKTTRKMLQRARTANVVQARLDIDNLLARYTQ